jgi:hypothetical protein
MKLLEILNNARIGATMVATELLPERASYLTFGAGGSPAATTWSFLALALHLGGEANDIGDLHRRLRDRLPTVTSESAICFFLDTIMDRDGFPPDHPVEGVLLNALESDPLAVFAYLGWQEIFHAPPSP